MTTCPLVMNSFFSSKNDYDRNLNLTHAEDKKAAAELCLGQDNNKRNKNKRNKNKNDQRKGNPRSIVEIPSHIQLLVDVKEQKRQPQQGYKGTSKDWRRRRLRELVLNSNETPKKLFLSMHTIKHDLGS